MVGRGVDGPPERCDGGFVSKGHVAKKKLLRKEGPVFAHEGAVPEKPIIGFKGLGFVRLLYNAQDDLNGYVDVAVHQTLSARCAGGFEIEWDITIESLRQKWNLSAVG
jgi:hypothetical protein